MNIKMLGSDYGGWVVDVDSINEGDTIIGGGVGEDITFEESLLEQRTVNIIAVDPTIKSHKFLENKNNSNVELIKKAIEQEGHGTVTIYKNTNPNYVSESVSNTHAMVGGDSYEAETISIKELRELYNPSLIKIDIEGSEYNVYRECIGVKQVCIEFHHHCMTDKSLDDTKSVIKEFEDNGYTVIDNRNYIELTFLKK